MKITLYIRYVLVYFLIENLVVNPLYFIASWQLCGIYCIYFMGSATLIASCLIDFNNTHNSHFQLAFFR